MSREVTEVEREVIRCDLCSDVVVDQIIEGDKPYANNGALIEVYTSSSQRLKNRTFFYPPDYQSVGEKMICLKCCYILAEAKHLKFINFHSCLSDIAKNGDTFNE